MKVNFFVIGQPKSGTTALYDYFKHHPELYLPEQKQLYYFAVDHNKERQLIKKFNRSYYKKYYNYSFQHYLKHFNFKSKCKYYCDITPDYFYSEKAPYEIFKYNPNAKILLLLREPLSFLKSFHLQMINSNCETEEDFWKAMELETIRKKNFDIISSCTKKYFFYSENMVSYINQTIQNILYMHNTFFLRVG